MNRTNLKGLQIGWRLAALRRNKLLTCPVCQKQFNRRGKRKLLVQGGKVCCSRKCRAVLQRDILIDGFNRKPKRAPVRACLICGSTFQKPPSQDSLYCSFKCERSKPGKWDYLKGSKHYNWKGGITPKNQKLRQSVEARRWTRNVFKSDNFTCRMCGHRGKGLEAHHRRSWADFPSLRFDEANGATLCKVCHEFIHWYEKHLMQRFDQLEEIYEF